MSSRYSPTFLTAHGCDYTKSRARIPKHLQGAESLSVKSFLFKGQRVYHRVGAKAEPEFRDITRRLKRYLFGSTAEMEFLLFSFRVVGKIYLVHFHKTTIKKIALLHGLNCFDICKYFKHNKLFSFYEKGSSNVTIHGT
jgi:hypothetical protein